MAQAATIPDCIRRCTCPDRCSRPISERAHTTVEPCGYLVSGQHHGSDGDAAGVSAQSFRAWRPGNRWGNSSRRLSDGIAGV